MIQLFLILATLVLVIYFFTHRKKANAKAWVKLGFVVLVFAAIWAILRPDDVTVVRFTVAGPQGAGLVQDVARLLGKGGKRGNAKKTKGVK